MNEREKKIEELDRWLLSASEGTASTEQTMYFNDLLAGDASLREYVAQRLADEALLIEQLQLTAAESILRGQSTLPSESVTPKAAAPPIGLNRWLLAAIAIAAIILLAFMVPSLLRDGNDPSLSVAETGDDDGDGLPPFMELHDDAVAIMTRSVDVQWADGQSPLVVDTRLGADTIRLNAGLIQLEFFSGATVVVEGPAELAIESPMSCKLAHGKVHADVLPQARGFTIRNASLDAVDLGTEFAMRVGEDGEGEVHVIDGEVLLQAPDGKQKRMLRVGEAVRYDATGELAELRTESESFVDIAELKKRDNARQGDRFQRWMRHSQEWANDPDLVLYYNFQQEDHDQRRLHSAMVGASRDADGAVIGCQWTEGRFENKGALEFKRTSDRVRVHVPGEFESLSMVVWLRVEGVDQWFNSLLLTDDWNPGEPHWQLNNSGKIRFGVSGDKDYSSLRALQTSDMGRWVQIATVYDPGADCVCFYLNGQRIKEAEIATPTLLRIGDAEIGNWHSSKQGPRAIRSLNGLVDEIAVFSRPLSGDEIQAAFEAGNPYQ